VLLTRHRTADGSRWALDGQWLPPDFGLERLLALPARELDGFLRSSARAGAADGALLAPIGPRHEVWAAGVTYERSREAREAESSVKDVYARVYDALRPELFWKAIGWRVVGHGERIRIRRDSHWNVPEPELTLVVNAAREIVGFCAGNDVSSRDIEGENPLYLPQAKVYAGSCALGPAIRIDPVERLGDLGIGLEVSRAGASVFRGFVRTAKMKRRLEELVSYLGGELEFPEGVFLMTGTGIVPPPEFSLSRGDRVRITIDTLTLENEVA